MSCVIMANLESELLRIRSNPVLPSAVDADRYDELKDRMLRIITTKGFRVTPDNQDAVDRLAAYFACFRGGLDGDWDLPRRGLFLYGPTGTGKTTIMRLFSALFMIEFIRIDELGKAFCRFSSDSFWNWIDSLDTQHIIIDDIGNEGVVRSFGQAFPMPVIIAQRDEVFRRRGILTFFTSNMTSSEPLAELYGEAFRSRLIGMIGKDNFINLAGKDNRLQ